MVQSSPCSLEQSRDPSPSSEREGHTGSHILVPAPHLMLCISSPLSAASGVDISPSWIHNFDLEMPLQFFGRVGWYFLGFGKRGCDTCGACIGSSKCSSRFLLQTILIPVSRVTPGTSPCCTQIYFPSSLKGPFTG